MRGGESSRKGPLTSRVHNPSKSVCRAEKGRLTASQSQSKAFFASARPRGERVERSFAHLYETGRMWRTHLRGHENILKRLLIHGGAFNLLLVLRKERGAGTPRGLAEAQKAFDWLWEAVRRPFSARQTLLLGLWTRLVNGPFRLDSPPRICGPARTA